MDQFQEAKKAFGNVVRLVNQEKPDLNEQQRMTLQELHRIWKNTDPMTLGTAILQLNSLNGRLTNSRIGSSEVWKEYVKKSMEIHRTLTRMAQEMQKKMNL